MLWLKTKSPYFLENKTPFFIRYFPLNFEGNGKAAAAAKSLDIYIYTSNMKTLIHLPGSVDKPYTDQPEHIDLGMAFVLYPEYVLCVCSNANPLHYYVLQVPHKVDR